MLWHKGNMFPKSCERYVTEGTPNDKSYINCIMEKGSIVQAVAEDYIFHQVVSFQQKAQPQGTSSALDSSLTPNLTKPVVDLHFVFQIKGKLVCTE